MIYLDTSWLAKLYLDEGDSEAVRRAIEPASVVFVSTLAFVEFHAAIARRRREGSIPARALASLITRFRADWPARLHVPVSAEVVARAALLATAHPLRSLDAIHLASALLIGAGSPELPRFGAADVRLVAAARAEGLPICAILP